MSAPTLSALVAELGEHGPLPSLLRSIHVVADLAANGLEHLSGCQIERSDMVAVLQLLADMSAEAKEAADRLNRLAAEVMEARHG